MTTVGGCDLTMKIMNFKKPTKLIYLVVNE